MGLLWFFGVFCLCARAAVANECSPCALRSCPLLDARDCGSGRVLARDPCGCCDLCSRLELEPCGGPDWTLGSCGSGLTCAALNRTGPARAPETGVCRVSPRCVHDGQELAEGEVYRMEPCWICQCRAGVSFCSKEECVELDCQSSYVPEGECCPVCIDVELLSAERAKASCWVSTGLRAHEEQWREDDCTFCQCVDGDPRCTAMACKQSCHNPVKIPGECCPYCEEPSYETVSPQLCPQLENCSLTGHDCPFGFTQDASGCLLCQCVHNDSCPDVSNFCTLDCPMGFAKDSYGCDLCECSVLPDKCRPMSCSKTCPYGYMRNKLGCEMCRCVRCPPFTCDKQCSGGYKKSRKGCSICQCIDVEVPISSSSVPVTVSSGSCVTASGRLFQEGESWHDGCRDCFCHAGREMCVLISCPVPTCSSPMLRADRCCPACEDESGSGQPDGSDLLVCRSPAGQLYVEGESWRLDECSICTCRGGRVLCETQECPPLLCDAAVQTAGSCCSTCPDSDADVEMGSAQESCVSGSGDSVSSGWSWKPDACSSCVCRNGSVRCFSQRCPAVSCRVPLLRKGQCCPHCLELSSTAEPTTLATTTWSDTTTLHNDTVPVRDAPGQVELTLIYQSAGWILAGLVLLVFLSAAALLHRRKSCTQTSCYSAPKKTVVLKKHVNTGSVVYMEPSRESSFGKSDAERICIPRAKLANVPR